MKRFLIYAFAGFLVTACGKGEVPPPAGTDNGASEGAIRFQIGITPPQHPIQTQADRRTRVATDEEFKSSWEEGDQIGLVASLNGSFYLRNAKLTYTKGAWVAEKTLLWPKESEEMVFRAYYPYDPQFDPSGYLFGVAADQNATTDGESNFNRSDFMLTDHGTVAKGETVVLSFKHQHVLIHLTLDNSAGAIDPNEGVRVKVRGVALKATLTLQEDIKFHSVRPDNTLGDITMQRVEQPGDPDYRTKFTFRAFIGSSLPLEVGHSIFRIANGDLLLDGSKLTETIDMIPSAALLFTQRLPLYHHTVPVSAGTFRMGSPDTDPNAAPHEKPRHWVKLTRDFHMSKYEVTRTQYAEFLNATGVQKANVGENVTAQVDGYGVQPLFEVNQWVWTPRWNDDTGKWEASGDYPMIYVSWYGAKAYADWVGGRLPTEAEWEYACRAGTETFYFFGDDGVLLREYAVYHVNNEGDGPSRVGTKKPNPWGLYDMYGNAFEWCMDRCDRLEYPVAESEEDAIVDPLTLRGMYNILRGGHWGTYEDAPRSGCRSYSLSPACGGDNGFRVVFDKK